MSASQVSASQVSGRKWRAAGRPAGRVGAKELEAGGGRGLGGASEATGGSAAPPPAAPPAPRSPNQAPGPAPARSADPPGGPAPHLRRAPRSSLKGPPLGRLWLRRGGEAGGAQGEGRARGRPPPFPPTAARGLHRAVSGPAAHCPGDRERCAPSRWEGEPGVPLPPPRNRGRALQGTELAVRGTAGYRWGRVFFPGGNNRGGGGAAAKTLDLTLVAIARDPSEKWKQSNVGGSTCR